MNTCRRTRTVAVLTLLLAFVWTPRALAEGVTDPPTGLQIRIEAPGAKVCIAIPEHPPDLACAGLRLEGLRAALANMSPVPSGYLVVRYPDWQFSMMMASAPGGVERPDLVRVFLSGLSDAAGKSGYPVRVHGENPGSRFDAIQVGGVHAVRCLVETDYPVGHPLYAGSRTLVYTFSPKNLDQLATVSFMSDPVHATEVRAVADATMAALSWTAPKLSVRPDGGPLSRNAILWRAYNAGSEFGRVVVVCAIVILVAGVSLVLRRTTVRRMLRASRDVDAEPLTSRDRLIVLALAATVFIASLVVVVAYVRFRGTMDALPTSD